MVKLQLVEIYAMSWRKRDVSILAPYLDDSFSYTSFWVYASLNRESYLDYLNGKFEALAKSGSNIDVSVGTNTIGDYARLKAGWRTTDLHYNQGKGRENRGSLHVAILGTVVKCRKSFGFLLVRCRESFRSISLPR